MSTDPAPDPETPDHNSTIPDKDPSAAPLTLSDDVRHGAFGFLMGAADIVPGVSGGTMALIVGIYARLITAISRIDRRFLQLVFSGQIAAAIRHADLRFLITLGCGIVLGAGGLASVMKILLTDHRTLTFAAFAGMILASSLLVARRIGAWSPLRVITLIAAAGFAWWLVTLPALQNPPDSKLYLFVCGMIGICAMILPGISGAFILLLMSRYETIVSAIRSFVHLELTADVLLTLIVFALGCATGLLTFSRVLKKLLVTHHDATIAAMCGFMLGSVYRLWPFQRDLTPDVEDLKHKVFEHFIPTEVNGVVWSAVAAAVVAGILVLSLDAAARQIADNRQTVTPR